MLHFIFSLGVILSSIWLSMALWIHQPLGWLMSRVLIGTWLAFTLSILGIYITQHLLSRNQDILVYLLGFALGLFWYFGMDAKQDRDWNPEVARMLHYEQVQDQVTLHNVRNFDWHADGRYTEHWETRQFNLKQITGVNIITSYWMGPKIAHTLVSFDFADQAPLTFSIEIRKERHEEFSAIGGFFRKYELSLVAADEKDIIYTRSNIRGEQVYFFPIQMNPQEVQALFQEYLRKADALAAKPRWYNTLTSNCTTLLFDMIQSVSQKRFPADYRLLASGYLPNYLYDLHALDHRWDMQTWYQRAHINPRVENLKDIHSQDFSRLIRQGVQLDSSAKISTPYSHPTDQNKVLP